MLAIKKNFPDLPTIIHNINEAKELGHITLPQSDTILKLIEEKKWGAAGKLSKELGYTLMGRAIEEWGQPPCEDRVLEQKSEVRALKEKLKNQSWDLTIAQKSAKLCELRWLAFQKGIRDGEVKKYDDMNYLRYPWIVLSSYKQGYLLGAK